MPTAPSAVIAAARHVNARAIAAACGARSRAGSRAVAASAVVLTAGYMLWAMQRVWLGKPNEKYLNLPDINPREIAMLVPLGIIVVVLGVYPHAILDLIDTSLQHLNSTVLAAGKAAGAVAAAAPGAVIR